MATTRNPKTRQMVQLAILSALVLLLAFTPIGYLRIGALNITFLPVPVVIGAVVLGPGAGAFLGLIFGLTSFAQCFGIDPMGTTLMTINLFYTFVMTVVTRVLMGYLVGVVHRVLGRLLKDKLQPVSYAIACGCGPLFNTILFMSAMYLFFGKEDTVLTTFSLGGPVSFFTFVFGLVFVNALAELVVSLIIGIPVCMALHRAKFIRR